MTHSKHTQGPYGMQEGKTLLHIETFESERGDGSLDTRTHICSVPKKNEANAEFIVRACNSHYDLLDALEVLAKWYKNFPIKPEHYKKSDDFVDAVLLRNYILDKADAAIAKAKGEA